MRPIGSKRQRCGSWEVRVTRGGVTLSGTVADEDAADAIMLSFAAQLGRDVSRAPSPTLSAWWQAWRDGRGQRLARVTLRRYEGSMRRCVLPALGHLRLRDVSGHWAAGTIADAIARGWVNGYPDHTFRPNASPAPE